MLFHKRPRKHAYEISVLRATGAYCRVELGLNSTVEISSSLNLQTVALPSLTALPTGQLSLYFLVFGIYFSPLRFSPVF